MEPLRAVDVIPMCMSQYQYMFSTTRIPHPDGDYLKQVSAPSCSLPPALACYTLSLAPRAPYRWAALCVGGGGAGGRARSLYATPPSPPPPVLKDSGVGGIFCPMLS